ncbi:response regulator [Hydrocarboniphaga effusa]|uniref:response regulator n=1 Tax=Hydrocarboniphaga effusa TaxID=243629 RepID=UPI00398C0A02
MTETIRVLVVDDEPQIRKLLRVSLGAESLQVIEAANAETGLLALKQDKPDLMILDLGLPDADGLDLIPRIREISSVPIIVLSVRDDEGGKVRALDAGADDYLTKPFGIAELLARIRAALRHRLQASGSQPVIETGALRIDLTLRRVTLDGIELRLSRKEYAILAVLARHAGRVITQPQLLREVWGKVHEEDTQYLRVYIGQLRHKLGDDAAAPRYVVTEPGVGYRLKMP